MSKTIKSGISVVIPIHEIDETTKPYLDKAVESIKNQTLLPEELIFVYPLNEDIEAAIKSACQELKDIKITSVINEGETDFASQMNLAVENVTTDHFSFLELDDEFARIWIKNAVEYIEAHDEVDVFLPLIIDVTDKGEFIGFTNEAVWANQFSDELGVLDVNSLLVYQNFNIDGMVMKTEIYKEFGGLKPQIKLTFIYEFLLRLTHNDVKIMTLPRVGYMHVNQREGGLFHTYKSTLSPDESQWWLNQAKKEYYFNHDRVITYEQ